MYQNGQDLSDMLAESIRSLSRMESAEGSEQDTLQGSGQAADGRVSAVAGPDGRLRELNLDPRVMRMASEDLAREILTAVNAALDDLRAGIPHLDPAALPDPRKLAESLNGVHADVVRRLDEFASEIEFTARRMEER